MSTEKTDLNIHSLVTEAKNLFEFLARAQSMREKSVYHLSDFEEALWLEDFPDHSAVSSAHRDADPQLEERLFSISRVARHDPPVIPADLEPWIIGKIRDSNSELSIADRVPAEKAPQFTPRSDEDGLSDVILLEDESTILHSADGYIHEWRKWAEQDRLDAPVRKLYDRLFQVMNQIEAHGEKFELVLGVGALAWEPEDHPVVLRHLLVFAAEIQIDDETGDLFGRRIDEGSSVKVELDMLDPSLVSTFVSDVRDGARNYAGHPLHQDDLSLVLSRFANGLDAFGSYSDAGEAPVITSEPRISFAPALIVRQRSQRGLIDMFENISKQIEQTGEVPAGLLPMVDPNYEVLSEEDTSPGGMIQVSEESEELFLPMPVNERQLRVIKQVNRKAQVVVQGPPGTGKTHTAAALLSHLLAQGKRVLVTAQTDRALHEVRGKLPDAIRPLSVAVVGSSQAEMSDLRVAVDKINRHADEHDASKSARTINEHLESIDKLRRERATTFTRLRQSREAETTNHVHGSYSGTLAAIVQQLENEVVDYGWLESFYEVSAGSTSPLSTGEALRWLELLNDKEIDTDGAESLSQYPNDNLLPNPADFALLIDGEAKARAISGEHEKLRGHDLYVDIKKLDPSVRQALHERTSNLSKQLRDIESRTNGWVADAFADIRSGRGAVWLARYEHISELTASTEPFVSAVGLASTVEYDAAQAPLLVDLAKVIRGYLIQGGEIKKNLDGSPKIGVFANKLIKQSQVFFEQVRVDGRPPTDITSVDKFLNHAHARNLLAAADRQWPDNVQSPQSGTLNQRMQWHRVELEQLAKALELGSVLNETEQWVSSHRLRVPNWSDTANVQFYAELVDATISAEALESHQAPLKKLLAVLRERQQWANASPVIASLWQAVSARDRSAYEVAYQRLMQLHQVRDKHSECKQLGEKLAICSQTLADAVRADPANATWGPHLGDLESAWNWVATRSWIRSLETADVNQFQKLLNAIDDQLRREIEGLAATRAWSHAVDETRMSGSARAHLRQYAQLVRRLGKGTGKYAEKQREEIRLALDHCRPSVPVWIMPLYRIADQFQIEPNMFDVVLVDEASQAGLEASFLQYLAPKIVVIGDDRQVSPAAVGFDQQRLRDLANQYLSNNKFKSSWQDPKRSYFDEATMRFGGKITLVEHRRCVPEIIGFSNKIAYEPDNLRLLPVRQRTAGSLPPVRAVHVAEGYEVSNTNRPEALAIVEQIVDCLADPDYDGKSMGVISLMGKEQAKLITGLLMEHLSPEDWKERDLRCGDAADFQGSERDVIFLSMVKTAGDGRRVTALTSEIYIQRYNVAASRAKDQMWLFHSLLLSDLGNPQDMRHALLDYVNNVQQRQDQVDPRILNERVSEVDRITPFDSLFEQRVFNRIYSRGYSVIPQYAAEGYKIDLVVVAANGNLAIECDGDAWHGPDQYDADMARQRDLERCGWNFFRVRESTFYIDKEAALADLWPLLEELNRVPELVPANSADARSDESDLDETMHLEHDGVQFETEQEKRDVELVDALSVVQLGEIDHGEPLIAGAGRGRHSASTESVSAELVEESIPGLFPIPSVLNPQVADESANVGSSIQGNKDESDPGVRRGYIFGEVDEVATTQVKESTKGATAFGVRAGYIFGEIDDEPTQEQPEFADAEPDHTVEDAGGEIAEYEHYRGMTRPALEATKDQIIDSLIQILEIEGPMVGARLESVYSKSSGQKLGRLIGEAIESAMRKAVRDDVMIEEKPLNEKFIKARTYRLPGQPSFRKRTAGERDIDEVPVAELGALLRARITNHENETTSQMLYRAVLADLGFRRLTSNAEKRLDLASRLSDLG